MGKLRNLTATYGNDTVVVEIQDEGTREMVMWGVGCTLFSVVIFTLATVQYRRRVASTPKAIKKRKLREEKGRRAREEKCIAEVPRDPIPVDEFVDVLKKKKKKGTLPIEFKALSRLQSENTCEVARMPENRRRNTYPDVLPFDHCRVILETPNNGSDYINASYVDAYHKPRAYIAAQGPNRHTIIDFWKMVWQENANCIVMATNVFEHARQQCEKYWHNQHGRYGKIDVWLLSTDILADFNIRTFKVTKDDEREERTIKQFQFANWSDHDHPNPNSLLEYRRRVKAFCQNSDGPLIVHCGSGDGRTGSFIAIDATLDRIEVEKTVDIFNYVLYLRNSRQNMIRNLEQYEFMYDTVAMYLMCGVTVIPARELPAVVQKLSVKDQQSKLNGFEREYKTLQMVVPKLTVGECAGGHRAENRRKSRDIMLQPPERARPYLITHDSNDSTDYINAVYVDGYGHTNAYIVTQWPLRSTVNDIWRLIYDYNIPTIVLLNDIPNSRSYPTFWPTEVRQEVPFGPLTVELEYEEEEKHVTSRVFRIRKPKKYEQLMEDFLRYLERKNYSRPEILKTLVSLQAMSTSAEESARQVKMFQLKSWPNSQKVPSSAASLIDLLTKVEEWQINSCHGRIPTCVISKNGVSRCGVYTAVSMAWDKLKSDGEVDVFHAVKTVKTNRPQLVENLVEFIYCYTFLVIMVEILSATCPNLIPCPPTEQPAHLVVETDTKRSGATNKPFPLLHDPQFPRQLAVHPNKEQRNANNTSNRKQKTFIKNASRSNRSNAKISKSSDFKVTVDSMPTVSIEMDDMSSTRNKRKQKISVNAKQDSRPSSSKNAQNHNNSKKRLPSNQRETQLTPSDTTVAIVHNPDGHTQSKVGEHSEKPTKSNSDQSDPDSTSGHLNQAFQTDMQDLAEKARSVKV